MAELIWIKLFIAIFDDEKMKYIDTLKERNLIICIWIKLLTQAGKTNKEGKICMEHNIPYTLPMLSIIFNRTEQEIKSALDLFEELRMIKVDRKGIITILKWEKHQNIEGMARVRELGRKRAKKYREKKKNENFFDGERNVTEINNNNVIYKSDFDNITLQNRKEENRKDERLEERRKEREEKERYAEIRDKIYRNSNINL